MIYEGGMFVVIGSLPDDERRGEPQTATKIENIEPGVFYYNLDRDPGEHSPIDPKQDPRARAMIEAMARHFEDIRVGAAEAEEALRALGYLK